MYIYEIKSKTHTTAVAADQRGLRRGCPSCPDRLRHFELHTLPPRLPPSHMNKLAHLQFAPSRIPADLLLTMAQCTDHWAWAQPVPASQRNLPTEKRKECQAALSLSQYT